VSGREKKVRAFAGEHEVILFVGGKDSSNGKHLYSLCHSVNPKSYYISGREDLLVKWFEGINDVGITGATSTPDWLMKEVSEAVQNI
jgi:4-hydroxy-3-methylbut-2-enyl diphosphate reductase